ncbi:Papain family cysteine protease [Popillia japonica]|uniref:Papain family cysteine protease n=1 Tax=Popillia japonica TaxID=7064 RepID=A0AAW1LTJ9_POPJA
MYELKWNLGILITACLNIIQIHTVPYAPDLVGSYCNQPDGAVCCNGRQDSCAFPILGTLCYCDAFCEQHNDDDCCPDFLFACADGPAPVYEATCPHKGGTIKAGKTVWDNCNSCTCTFLHNRTELLCHQPHTCLMEKRIIDTVNLQGIGWTAKNYSFFWNQTLDKGIKYKLGTLQPERFVMRMNPVRRIYDPNSLPTEFDAESVWPGDVSGIVEQGWCGSSWAVSTAAVASDRYGIVSKGRQRINLSPQHLLSCNNRGQQSCDGGHLDRAWMYFRKQGIVEEACFPYTGRIETCNRHYLDRCPMRHLKKTNKYKVGPAYRLGNETDIMYEIMKSGPVQATMKVYHDFYSYERGIYEHTDLSIVDRTGYHSVRIVGWGEDRGRKYWKVANSWGTEWGENGFFRIVKGKNECDIESFVLAVWPELEEY